MSTIGTGLPAIPPGAILYQRAVTNSIGATAASSNNIGYLATNRTQLEVVGQLTGQDPTDYYNFTFQTGGTLQLSVLNVDDGSNSPDLTDAHVQLYDGSGTRLLADNQGTAAQQTAYDQLTSSQTGGGTNLAAGKYVIKITYGQGDSKTQNKNYAFQINSGTYQSDYRTLANASTIQNTLLGGGSLGYSSLSDTAAMLTSLSQGSSLSVFGALALFQTNIFGGS